MLAATVLTGGHSSRMGFPKQNLKIEGQTWLENVLNVLDEINIPQETTYISGCGYRKNRNVVEDIKPHLGPLGGIYSVMRTIYLDNTKAIKRLLVLPVDMPFISTKSLSRLVEASINPKGAYYFSGSYLPCSLPIDETLWYMLTSIISEVDPSKRSLKRLFYMTKAISLEHTFQWELRNINTLDQYREHFPTVCSLEVEEIEVKN